MKSLAYVVAMMVVLSATATGKVTLRVYESDGQTQFDNRRIMVGEELKLVIVSDANDFWSGGLFIDDCNRNSAALSGSGKDPNSRDYSDCHLEDAGPKAEVTWWEDSVMEGFDLFSDNNSLVPGDWFEIGYTALAAGDPNVGFYEYSISWDDPNTFMTFHQVPTADFNLDGIVNFIDYSALASWWLEDDCTDPNCQMVDISPDGVINVNDLIIFADDWLWGAPEPNEPNIPAPVIPDPDPNLVYSVVDANGLDEITINVGQTVTLYVDMATYDVNEVWAFTIEVDISDPNLGEIDNRSSSQGTACILAGPDRWTAFDRWGPGVIQDEGIQFTGISSSGAFEEGHLASFEFTCKGAGDVELTVFSLDSTSTSGGQLYPTLEGMLIHQNDPNSQAMGASSMMATSMSVSEEPTMTSEEMVEFLGEIWLQDDGTQEVIDEEDWKKFIESVESSYQSQ